MAEVINLLQQEHQSLSERWQGEQQCSLSRGGISVPWRNSGEKPDNLCGYIPFTCSLQLASGCLSLADAPLFLRGSDLNQVAERLRACSWPLRAAQ